MLGDLDLVREMKESYDWSLLMAVEMIRGTTLSYSSRDGNGAARKKVDALFMDCS